MKKLFIIPLLFLAFFAKGQNTLDSFGATIATGPFAFTYSSQVKGSPQSVATWQLRNAIPSYIRAIGQFCKVTGVDSLYWLQGGTANANWIPFAAGTTLTFSSPLSLSGTNVAIQQASGSQPGYLGMSDWNTFNNKQPALGFTAENVANKTATVSNSTTTYPNWYGLTHFAYPKTHLDSILNGFIPFTGNISTNGSWLVSGGGGSTALSAGQLNVGSTGNSVYIRPTGVDLSDATYDGFLYRPVTMTHQSIWRMPDTSGTVALNGNIKSTYVPYTGGIKPLNIDSIQVNRYLKGGKAYTQLTVNGFGTSIMAGTMPALVPLGDRYFTLFAKGVGMKENNQSISGSTTVTWLANLGRIPAYNAQTQGLYVFNISTNDIQVLSLDTTSFKVNYGKIIDTTIIRRNVPPSLIILETPPIMRVADAASEAAYRLAIIHLAAAKGVKVADVNAYEKARGTRAQLLQADSIHETQLGNYLEAECLLRTVSGLNYAGNASLTGSLAVYNYAAIGDTVHTVSNQFNNVGLAPIGLDIWNKDLQVNGTYLNHGFNVNQTNINIGTADNLSSYTNNGTGNVLVFGQHIAPLLTIGTYDFLAGGNNVLYNSNVNRVNHIGFGAGQNEGGNDNNSDGYDSQNGIGHTDGTGSDDNSQGSLSLFKKHNATGVGARGSHALENDYDGSYNDVNGYYGANAHTGSYLTGNGAYVFYNTGLVDLSYSSAYGYLAGANSSATHAMYFGIDAGDGNAVNNRFYLQDRVLNNKAVLLYGKLDTLYLAVNKPEGDHFMYPDRTPFQAFAGNGLGAAKFTGRAYTKNGYGIMVNDTGTVNATANGDVLIGHKFQTNLNNTMVTGGSITAGGSGYVNATYPAVLLTGGHGVQCYVSIAVTGGAVTSVGLLNGDDQGTGFQVGDVLTTSNINLGGTGSGFSYTVSAVGYTSVTAYQTWTIGAAYVTGAQTANSFVKIGGTSAQYLMADGSVSTGGGGGSGVTSVTSANADIAVATTTTTPVLTLNSSVTGGANKIVKLDGSGYLGALNGSALTNLTAANITASGTLPALNGSALTSLTSTNISGIIPAANLGTGTASSTTVLYGDGQYRTAGTATMAIGSAVTSGTAKSILYVGSGPVLAQTSTFAFDGVNLGVGTATPGTILNLKTTGYYNCGILLQNGSSGVNVGIIGNSATYHGSGASDDLDIASGGSNYTNMLTLGVNIGTETASGDKLNVAGTARATQYKLSALNTAPSSSTDTGTLGEIRVTAGYIYICTATNTWVRTALTTF